MQQPARLETASGGTGAPLVPEKALHEAIVVCDYWGMRRIRLSQAALIGSTALVAGWWWPGHQIPHPPQEPCLAGYGRSKPTHI
jgi:hypothetical protein